MSAADLIELAAWRYLAAHRVGDLAVTHITFIDCGDECRINTPSFGDYYESAKGSTFGEAAIALATALGMRCPENTANTEQPIGSPTLPSVCDPVRNTAPTASAGGSSKNLRRTRSRKMGATTDATGADLDTGESAGPQRAVESR